MPKFLNNVDLNNNQILNVRLQNLASAPTTAVGMIYCDTTIAGAATLRFWDGTGWITLGSAEAAGTVTSVGASVPGGFSVNVTNPSTTPSIAISTTLSGMLKGTGTGFSAAVADTDYLTPTGNGSGLTALNASNISTGTVHIDRIPSIPNTKLTTDPLARANHTGTQLASTISNFDTQVRTSRLDQMAVPTASVALNSQRITGLGTPTTDTDASTKAYVDALISGLDIKASVRVASTANVNTSSAPATIDGVTLASGDRVLLKDQTTASQNGIFVFNGSAAAMTRATDADANAELTAGMFVFVEEGTTNADSGWVLTTNNPITVAVTSLTFTQFSGAGQITAGAGLTKTGNTIDVVGTSNRITVNADSVDIAATYVGQTSITTLGTITSGTWNATTIALNRGGTGATTQSDAANNILPTQTGNSGRYLTTNGSVVSWAVVSGGSSSYKGTITGNGSATSFTISQSTHGRAADYGNTVAIYDPDSTPAGQQIYADVYVNPSTGDVRIDFAVAPVNAKIYRVVIQG